MVQSNSVSLSGSDWGSNGSCSDSESLCFPAFLASSTSTGKRQPGVVSHDYHDLKDAPVVAEEAGGSGKPQAVRHRGAVKQFPSKLYDILSKAHEEGSESIVSWQPHGRCFIVRKPEAFTGEIMPRFFKGHSKLSSFQRQLSLYGFLRLTCGRDKGAYYHERFLRGRPDLVHQLVRTRVKGTGRKLATSPSSEPDFYGMPFCGVDGNVEVNIVEKKPLVPLVPATGSSTMRKRSSRGEAAVAATPEPGCNVSRGTMYKCTEKPLLLTDSRMSFPQVNSVKPKTMPVTSIVKATKTPPVGPLAAPGRLCNALKGMPQLAFSGSTMNPATVYSTVSLPRDSSAYEMAAAVASCTGAARNIRTENLAVESNGSRAGFSSESLATEPLLLLSGIPPSPTGVMSSIDAMFWKQEQETVRQIIPCLPEEDDMSLDEFMSMWDA